MFRQCSVSLLNVPQPADGQLQLHLDFILLDLVFISQIWRVRVVEVSQEPTTSGDVTAIVVTTVVINQSTIGCAGA